MRRAATLLAGLGASLVLASPAAGAAITKVRVSVDGTQISHAHVTYPTGCTGDGVAATGDFTETSTLHTYRQGTMVVLPLGGTALALEPRTGDPPEILLRGTIARTSTLGPDGQVLCGRPPAACGTLPFPRLELEAGVEDSPSGRRFRGIVLHSSPVTPRNPFSACASPPDLAGVFPSVISADGHGGYFDAPFPRSSVNSCRRGKVTRRLRGTLPVDVPGTTAISGASTVDLSITITRLGPLRGYRC